MRRRKPARRRSTLGSGLFINALINFLIIAFVVFWIGKAAARLMRCEAETPSAPPTPTRSEVLLDEIRDLLSKQSAEPPTASPERFDRTLILRPAAASTRAVFTLPRMRSRIEIAAVIASAVLLTTL